MHMADALVSPLVAGVMGITSGVLLIVAAKKVRNNPTENILPLMGVMGAFIFAAQMINFSIPGTGSSGHIVGGVLLSAVLGPWAAFITLASVIVIQCFLFADGGLMALGCNIFNMAACTCLIAYPLVFRFLLKYPASLGKIIGVSLLTCVIGLELGAVAVTVETEFSGITALPMAQFLLFMLPIHLLIGIGEGLATASVVCFIQKYKPGLLLQMRQREPASHKKTTGFGKAVLVFALLALFLGISFTWIASSDPDGLEWSISNVTGHTELPVASSAKAYAVTRHIQESTALMPDYNTGFAGIVGGVLVVLITWAVAGLLQYKKKTVPKNE